MNVNKDVFINIYINYISVEIDAIWNLSVHILTQNCGNMNDKSICAILLLLVKIAGYYSYYISPLKKNICTPHTYKGHRLKLQNEKPEIDNNIINYFKNIRSDYPFFQQNNSPIYFDNAATTHKPKSVIEVSFLEKKKK